ncbi:MAG: MerR family transcriptional regulator [Bacteroidota bacterium]
MKIGEIAQKTGFSRDTLRWYEKIGLIKSMKKSRGDNNYRKYDEATLERLLYIRKLKLFGFTLKEIEHIFDLEEGEALICSNVSDMIDKKQQAIEEKIQELRQIQTKLTALQNSCQGNCRETMESLAT